MKIRKIIVFVICIALLVFPLSYTTAAVEQVQEEETLLESSLDDNDEKPEEQPEEPHYHSFDESGFCECGERNDDEVEDDEALEEQESQPESKDTISYEYNPDPESNDDRTHSETVTVNNAAITVSNIPDGIYIKLNSVEDASEISALFKERYGEDVRFDIISIFDIELTDGQDTWQPCENGTTVEISVPVELENPDDVAIFRYDEETETTFGMVESEALTKIEEHEYEDGMLTFETDHFSTFMIGSLSADTSVNSNAEGYDYNAAMHTLTLTDCNLTTNSVQPMGSCQAYYDGDLHLILNGTNTFSVPSDYGIYVSGILTITGTGSLDISNIGTGIYARKGIVINSGMITTHEMDKGLYSDWGEIDINGGIVIAEKLIKTENSKNISISDATVSARKIDSSRNLSSEQSTINANGIKSSLYTIDGGTVRVDATQDMGEMHNEFGHYLSLNGISGTTILNSGTLEVTIHDHDGDDYYTLDTGIGKLNVNNGIAEIRRVSDDDSKHCWDYGVGYLTVNDGTVTLDNCSVSQMGNMYVNGGNVIIESSYGGAGEATVTGGTVNATVTGNSNSCCFKVLSQSGGEVNIISSGVGVGRIDDNSAYSGGLNLTAGQLTINAGTYGVSTRENIGYIENDRGNMTSFPHMNFAGGEAYITGGIQALKYDYAFTSKLDYETGRGPSSARYATSYYGEKYIHFSNSINKNTSAVQTHIYVGDAEVTSSVTSGAGWSYDSSNNKLLLSSYSGNATNSEAGSTSQIYADGDMKLDLSGANALGVSSGFGIYCDGILTITGAGSLDISNIGTGIYARKGIVINSGTITTHETDKGLYSDWGEIDINGGTVTADKLIKTENSKNINIYNMEINAKKIASSGNLKSEHSNIHSNGIDASLYTIDGGTVTVEATQDMGEMYNEFGHYLSLNGISGTVILNSGTLEVTIHDHDGDDYYTLDTGIGKLTVNNGTAEIRRVSDDDSKHCWDYGVGYLTVNDGTVTLDNCSVSQMGNMYVNGGNVTIESSYGGARQATVTSGIVNVSVTGNSNLCCFEVLSQSGGEVNIISSGVGVGRINDDSGYSGGLNLTAGKLTINAGTYGVSTMSSTGYIENDRGNMTSFPHMNFAGGEAYITGGIQALKYKYDFTAILDYETGIDQSNVRYATSYYGEKYIHFSNSINKNTSVAQTRIYVGDTEVTSSVTSGTGWSYDSSNNTLLLDSYSGTSINSEAGSTSQIYADGDLKIDLSEANALGVASGFGIYCDGILTITGAGSLDISNTDTGIYARKGIVINSGIITTHETDRGLYSDWGEIDINGGTVTAEKLIKTENSKNISISDATVDAKKIDSAGSLSSERSTINTKGIRASVYTIDGGNVSVDVTQDMGEMYNEFGHYLSLGGISGTVILNSGTLEVTIHDHDGDDYYTLDTGIGKLTVNNGNAEIRRVSDDDSKHCWDYGVGYLTVNDGTVTLDNCSVSQMGNMYVNGGNVTIESSYGGAGEATVTGGTVNATVTGNSNSCCFKVLSQSGGEVNIISSGVGVGRIDDNSGYSGGLNLTAGQLTINAGTYGVSTMENIGYIENDRGNMTSFPHMNFAGGEAYITGGIQALKYNYVPVFSPGAILRTGDSKDTASPADGYYGEKFIDIFVVREIIITPSEGSDLSGDDSSVGTGGNSGSGNQTGSGGTYPSTLPYETILGLGGEGTYSDIRALDSTVRDVTNQTIFANYYAAMLGRNAEMIATKDLYSPYGATPAWKGSQRLIIWKNLGLMPGDEVYIVWYCQEAHDMRFIKAVVSDAGAVYAYIPCLGGVSTVSIVRLTNSTSNTLTNNVVHLNTSVSMPSALRTGAGNILQLNPETMIESKQSDIEPAILASEMKSADKTRAIWYLTFLAVIMSFIYFAYASGYGRMTETKKNLVIQSLKRASLRYGRSTQILAVVLVFFVLLYYHLIGKRTEHAVAIKD